MKILIADDDRIVRLLLASALRSLGHEVDEAENGQKALQTWESGNYALIISDWMMPDLDGLELCSRIRRQPRSDYTYIIFLTSRSGKTNYLDGMNAGADDFITKPFEKDALAARIRVAERILGLHEDLRAANAGLERRVGERTVALEDALKAKSELLSRASHELRTPMNHILGFAQILAMDNLKPEQQDNLRQILRSGKKLLILIDRILAVSHLASEELNFEEPGQPAIAPEHD